MQVRNLNVKMFGHEFDSKYKNYSSVANEGENNFNAIRQRKIGSNKIFITRIAPNY